MSMTMPDPVIGIRDARANFAALVDQVKSDGPVVIGAYRRPEAVLLSADTYQQLLQVLEDREIAELVRKADQAGDWREATVEGLADSLGIDLP